MQVEININSHIDAIRDFYRELSDKEFKKAIARAMNHSLAKGRTQYKREITSIYNIPSSYAFQATEVGKARANYLEGSIKAKTHYTPIGQFQPKQVLSTTKGNGYSKNVSLSRNRKGYLQGKRVGSRSVSGMTFQIKKGEVKTIASAFFLPSQAKGLVMARGNYDANRVFQFRHHRVNPTGNDTPINAIKTVSVFKSAVNTTVQKRIDQFTQNALMLRIEHELKFMVSNKGASV